MYIHDMRYRLKEEGIDSLLNYVQQSHRSISWLSDKTNITRQQIRKILLGKTKRTHPDNLEAIGKALGLQVDFDEYGIYFQEPISPEKDAMSEEVREVVDILNSKSRSERKRILKILKSIIENLK